MNRGEDAKCAKCGLTRHEHSFLSCSHARMGFVAEDNIEKLIMEARRESSYCASDVRPPSPASALVLGKLLDDLAQALEDLKAEEGLLTAEIVELRHDLDRSMAPHTRSAGLEIKLKIARAGLQKALDDTSDAYLVEPLEIALNDSALDPIHTERLKAP